MMTQMMKPQNRTLMSIVSPRVKDKDDNIVTIVECNC